jgi:hypothetical protein
MNVTDGATAAARRRATLGELVRDTPIVQPVTVPHPIAS